MICCRFPHSQNQIKEGKKKFNTECKEVISEELTAHMKAMSLTWMKQSFSLEQQRQMHQIADELKFLKAQDLGLLQSRIQTKLQKDDYAPYVDHIDKYVLAKLK